jgi:hypothetical protein
MLLDFSVINSIFTGQIKRISDRSQRPVLSDLTGS